jgi:hypothetical protein
MQDAQSLGPPNLNPKLQCQLLKLSILQWHKLYVMSFISWDYYRKWGSEISRFFVPSPACTARSLKTWIIFYAGAQSRGPPNFNPKLQCQLLKLRILQCHKFYVMSFLSLDYYRKWGSEISKFFVPSPTCIARSLKTTQAPSNLCKFYPWTEHINVCCHYFCEHLWKGLIKIFPIDTKDQIADALTKPLAQHDFQRHCCLMCNKWPPKVTKLRECYVMRNFGVYFTVTYVFLLVLCESAYCTKVQYFIKYWNSCLEIQSYC